MNADSLRRFAAAVQRPDAELELDRAALLLGEWADGPVDVAAYRARLDDLAAEAARVRDDLAGKSFAGVRAVTRVLFTDGGFAGNADDYYDPRNSFLRQVLERRTGIPISLSVLYLEIGRRIGERMTGVGFPGHFLVRGFDGDRAVVVDPFNRGAVLGKGDLEALLVRVLGADAKLEPSLLAPVGKAAILTRMLVNLAGIYGQRGDLFGSLEVLERLHLVDPVNPKLARELEALRARCDDLN